MASWVDGEYRVLWEFGEAEIINIVDYGTHKEVYQ